MKYNRNPSAVTANFTVNSAKQVICKNSCYIQVPMFFFDQGLGTLGADISIYGCFVVILEDGQYGLVNTTAMFSISPTSTNIKTIDGMEYYEFFFAKDSVIFKTTGLLQQSKIIYDPFQNFLFMGRVPWYISYDDHGRLFATAPKFAGFGALRNPEVMEFLTAMCARKANSTSKDFLREQIKDYSEGDVGNVEFVPMGSVVATVRSSLNKISGAYAQDGIISAIVSPYDRVGTVEKIVRA